MRGNDKLTRSLTERRLRVVLLLGCDVVFCNHRNLLKNSVDLTWQMGYLIVDKYAESALRINKN